MKKLVIAASIALLAACSAPSQPQINFMPQATLSKGDIVKGKSFTLMSKDVRTSQYVALVDAGRKKTIPIQAHQNVRIAIENALSEQFKSEGFELSVNSENTVTVEVQEALVTVKHSMLENQMNANVIIAVTAETPKGKLIKTYNGTGKRTAAFSASKEDIANVLNDVTDLVLKKVAEDKELQDYMKERF